MTGAPRPLSDELGYPITRERIEELQEHVMFRSDTGSRDVGLILDALLADRDRLSAALEAVTGERDDRITDYLGAGQEARQQRERAECAEKELERSRFYGDGWRKSAEGMGQEVVKARKLAEQHASVASVAMTEAEQLRTERDALRRELAGARERGDALYDELASMIGEVDEDTERSMLASLLKYRALAPAADVPGAGE